MDEEMKTRGFILSLLHPPFPSPTLPYTPAFNCRITTKMRHSWQQRKRSTTLA